MSYKNRQEDFLSRTNFTPDKTNLHKKKFNITFSKNQKVVDLQNMLTEDIENGFIAPLQPFIIPKKDGRKYDNFIDKHVSEDLTTHD